VLIIVELCQLWSEQELDEAEVGRELFNAPIEGRGTHTRASFLSFGQDRSVSGGAEAGGLSLLVKEEVDEGHTATHNARSLVTRCSPGIAPVGSSPGSRHIPISGIKTGPIAPRRAS